MDYTLIIFDIDGTLVATKSGATFRKSATDWKWLPGRLERLQELRAQGIEIAFASNQGGVPLGYMNRQDIEHEIMLMAVQVPTLHRYICYAYPPNKNEYYTDREFLFFRKPNPGMLLQAMLDAKSCVPETLMVGDLPDDEQAARNAGVAFMWADEFFK